MEYGFSINQTRKQPRPRKENKKWNCVPQVAFEVSNSTDTTIQEPTSIRSTLFRSPTAHYPTSTQSCINQHTHTLSQASFQLGNDRGGWSIPNAGSVSIASSTERQTITKANGESLTGDAADIGARCWDLTSSSFFEINGVGICTYMLLAGKAGGIWCVGAAIVLDGFSDEKWSVMG